VLNPSTTPRSSSISTTSFWLRIRICHFSLAVCAFTSASTQRRQYSLTVRPWRLQITRAFSSCQAYSLTVSLALTGWRLHLVLPTIGLIWTTSRQAQNPL
jgi:hypothetical protein